MLQASADSNFNPAAILKSFVPGAGKLGYHEGMRLPVAAGAACTSA
jgi:hypothetical protein